MSRRVVLPAGLFLVSLAGAVVAFDQLFEEPRARRVASLVEELGSRSALVILAHPDDEILLAGLLADAAARDSVVVTTISATRGEKGYVDPPISRREDLALIRSAELHRYGFVLGVDDQEQWDYPDSALESIPLLELARPIAKAMRVWRPDLVVTFDPATGFTSHPDHKAIGRAATLACSLSRDEQFEPVPRALHTPAWLAYVVPPRRALRLFGGASGRMQASRQPTPNAAAPGNRKMKLEGLRIHESQAGVLRRTVVPPELLFCLLRQGTFRRAIAAGGRGGSAVRPLASRGCLRSRTEAFPERGHGARPALSTP